MELMPAAGAVWLHFGYTVKNLLLRPYETTREIVDRGAKTDLLALAALGVGYFALASLVRTAAFRPFLLTREFIVLASAAAAGYLLAIGTVWLGGKMLKGRGNLGGLIMAWGFSYLPTLLWFFTTSVLYVFLPPPRTESTAGILLSLVFLVFSAVMLFWKVLLVYLSIRFSLKLDLIRIVGLTAILIPVLGAFSVGMYRLGIFKIPFI